MKIIGYTVVTIGVIFLNSVWSGYAFSILWEWFVVSAFNAPKIDIPTAIGLALITSFLTHQASKEEKGREFSDILTEGVFTGILKPAFVLFAGWIITLFL